MKPVKVFLLIFAAVLVISGVRHLRHEDSRKYISYAIKRIGINARELLVSHKLTTGLEEKVQKLEKNMPVETVLEIMGKPYHEPQEINGELLTGYESRDRYAKNREWKYKMCVVVITNGVVKDFFGVY